jgi:hypothetical protein
MNDNINMDSTIAESMNDNMNMDSTIAVSMNDNINMDSTIAVSIRSCCHSSTTAIVLSTFMLSFIDHCYCTVHVYVVIH